MVKMAANETICFQDEIPVILITCLELETYIKGHHVYKEVWTPELGEQLNVRIEPDNRVDKFAVCVEKDEEELREVRKDDFLLSQK